MRWDHVRSVSRTPTKDFQKRVDAKFQKLNIKADCYDNHIHKIMSTMLRQPMHRVSGTFAILANNQPNANNATESHSALLV